MINKFSFTMFTFSLLSICTSKFQTWQFFLVKGKLACQIFLDKENLPTNLHLHEQFFLVKVNLSKKNCSCKWGLTNQVFFLKRETYLLSTTRFWTVSYQWLGKYKGLFSYQVFLGLFHVIRRQLTVINNYSPWLWWPLLYNYASETLQSSPAGPDRTVQGRMLSQRPGKGRKLLVLPCNNKKNPTDLRKKCIPPIPRNCPWICQN